MRGRMNFVCERKAKIMKAMLGVGRKKRDRKREGRKGMGIGMETMGERKLFQQIRYRQAPCSVRPLRA